MRCLHCGKRLTLLRKFSDGEFCSAEHRQTFHQQQSDLALARLLESQTRIERPVIAKPAPVPVMRSKAAVVADGEKPIPEAPILVEWFKPTSRKVLFEPTYRSFDPRMSSWVPVCPVPLRQQGFPVPDELVASVLALSPMARHWRPAVLNPLFRLGIRLPYQAQLAAPRLEPGTGELQSLAMSPALAGLVATPGGEPGVFAWTTTAALPGLALVETVPDRPQEPEPLPFVDALMPLGYPSPGQHPVSLISEPPPLAVPENPIRGLASDCRPERVADDAETEWLPQAEVIFPLSLPQAGRGPALDIRTPALGADQWNLDGPAGAPEDPARFAVPGLRTESKLEPVSAPEAVASESGVCGGQISAVMAESEPARPVSNRTPRAARMRQTRRSARLKIHAMAAVAGAELAGTPRALTSSMEPSAPQWPGWQAATNLGFEEGLRALEYAGIQDLPRTVAAQEPRVEIVDVAAAPCVPALGARPEAPIPVLLPPDPVETMDGLGDLEPIVVRVVRPLIEDPAWGMPPIAVVPMGDGPADTLSGAQEATVSGQSAGLEAGPADIPAAAMSEALEASPVEELVALERGLEATPVVAAVDDAGWAATVVEAAPPVEVAATIPSAALEEAAVPVEALEAMPPVAVLEAVPRAALEEAAPAMEVVQDIPPAALEAAAPLERVEESAPVAVETTAEPEGAEAAETESPLPMCAQIRIFAGRGESGVSPAPRASRKDDAGIWIDTLGVDPMKPASRLMIDHADGSGPRRTRNDRAPKKSGGLFHFDTRKLPGRRFWAHAPSDLKWVALGLPLILALVVYSFKASPPKTEAGRSVAANKQTSVIATELGSIQKVILDRAAIKLYDDFRGGLGSWSGSDGWAKTWKYGEASFLEPGQLALYTPTVNMRDYTMQFLGQIERRSLNWVFRAVDSKNYYAMRIVITKSGPLPQASVVRYAVINGKEVGTKTLPLPFPVHSDTLYLVKMEVRGDSFVTYIQSQVVDNFTDGRLESGGVGFFSPRGDKSFLRWVEVTHQYDYLGRLCALLAPYNVQAEGKKSK